MPMNPLRRLKAASQVSASTVPGAGSHRPASRSLSRPHPVRELESLPSNDSRRPACAQAEEPWRLVTPRCAQHLFQRDQDRRSLGRRRLRPNFDHFRINAMLACRFSGDACFGRRGRRRRRPYEPSGRDLVGPRLAVFSLDSSTPRLLDSPHSGILPCLRGGVETRLERARASARISQGRVWLGTMTSST